MKNNKNLVWILIIIIVVLVLALTYSLGKNSKIPAQNPQVNNYQPITENNVPTVPVVKSITGNSENSSTGIFNKQPGMVKVLTPELGVKWVLAVDLLTPNPNFIPGETSFFINQNPKIRNLIATYDTKTYKCGTDSKPDISENTADFINDMQKNIVNNGQSTVYFDINGTNIIAMYQQCLP